MDLSRFDLNPRSRTRARTSLARWRRGAQWQPASSREARRRSTLCGCTSHAALAPVRGGLVLESWFPVDGRENLHIAAHPARLAAPNKCSSRSRMELTIQDGIARDDGGARLREIEADSGSRYADQAAPSLSPRSCLSRRTGGRASRSRCTRSATGLAALRGLRPLQQLVCATARSNAPPLSWSNGFALVTKRHRRRPADVLKQDECAHDHKELASPRLSIGCSTSWCG